jgi:hypothetical protein
MTYKVLRLLEYTYPTAEAAEKDMARWGIGAISVAARGQAFIRSTIIQHPEADDE